MLFLSWKIRLGDNNLEDSSDDHGMVERGIKKISIHPRYKPTQAYFDVAIMEIDEVVRNYTNTFKTLSLTK